MHVVFLSPVGTLGGAERVLLTAVAAIRRTEPGIRISVVVAGDGPLLDAVRHLGAKALSVPMPAQLSSLTDTGAVRTGFWKLCRGGVAFWSTWLDFSARLGKVFSELRPDVIHSNGIKMHLLAACTRPRRTAVVWHIHDFIGLRFTTPWLLRLARRRVTAIAISHAVADDIRRVLPGLRVRVINNAIDEGFFAVAPCDGVWLDRLAVLPEMGTDTVRVGLVATYALWKGHDVFLQAVALLSRDASLPPARFFIVGGPVYQTLAQRSEAELRRLAEALGVENQIGFIGFQDNVATVYRALDVVVHASTQPEPFGLTIAEAMACGRAVVVSRSGGAVELCTPEHDALGTTPGDVRGLAAAIRRLIASAGLRQRLGENARTTALQRFHPLRFGKQLVGVYAEARKQASRELMT